METTILMLNVYQQITLNTCFAYCVQLSALEKFRDRTINFVMIIIFIIFICKLNTSYKWLFVHNGRNNAFVLYYV